jgi:hypothetical protein
VASVESGNGRDRIDGVSERLAPMETTVLYRRLRRSEKTPNVETIRPRDRRETRRV